MIIKENTPVEEIRKIHITTINNSRVSKETKSLGRDFLNSSYLLTAIVNKVSIMDDHILLFLNTKIKAGIKIGTKTTLHIGRNEFTIEEYRDIPELILKFGK